jgi:hypothetical protein
MSTTDTTPQQPVEVSQPLMDFLHSLISAEVLERAVLLHRVMSTPDYENVEPADAVIVLGQSGWKIGASYEDYGGTWWTCVAPSGEKTVLNRSQLGFLGWGEALEQWGAALQEFMAGFQALMDLGKAHNLMVIQAGVHQAQSQGVQEGAE